MKPKDELRLRDLHAKIDAALGERLDARCRASKLKLKAALELAIDAWLQQMDWRDEAMARAEREGGER